jgi:hypothetical protein
MLLVRPYGDFGVEVAFWQRPGQLTSAVLEMLEILAVGQQIEDEDFHK